jgi:subfamily B ATP-binding cassette protein MsbA
MSPLRKILGLGVFRLPGFVPGLLAGLLAVAVYTAAQVSIPLVSGSIIDKALLPRDAHALLVRVLLLVGAATVSTLARGVQQMVFSALGERSRAELQARLLIRLYEQPLAFFERERSGRLQSLLTEDAAAVARLSFQVLSEAAVGVLQLGLILGVLALRYGQATLAALVLIPVYMIFPLVFGRRIRSTSRDSLAATAEVTTTLQESIQAVREMKVFGREAWAVHRLRERLATDVARQLRLVLLRSLHALSYAVYFLVAGTVYWFGGLEVLAGHLTVGGLVALVSLLAYLDGPVSRLAQLNADLQRVLAASDRISRIVEVEAGPEGDAGGGELAPGGHRVSYDGVEFRYGEAGAPILKDISFSVEPGQRVAIVGPSGAGKSTLVGLLARLYEPGKGRISIDDRDLHSFRLSSLRQEIGFVLQETVLFAGTVEENLRFGKLDATREEVEESARIANAHEFIRRLPQGYATEIGERGVKLSGGQRQRIGIARILLRKPGILVLDEAMSALDTEAERSVREALERLMEGRTTFVITHRPSAFVGADRILVIDGGRIVAIGRHEELLASCDIYRHLVGEGAAAGTASRVSETGDRK